MDQKIDCSVACPNFIRILNSCPSRNINIYGISTDDIFEIAMVLLSISPYLISFIIMSTTIYYRTIKSVLIMMMIFIGVSIFNILNSFIKEFHNRICERLIKRS
jgi:hypothetical protein